MAAASRKTTEPRWLDADEMRAWRSFIETVGEVQHELDHDLMTAHGLSLGDYQVLVMLSEADEHRLRMCDLATQLRISPSGLTRRLDGLVADGMIERVASGGDRRVTLAALTAKGRDRLHRAAPDHVASVRARLLDHLTPAQVRAMADVFATLQAGRSHSAD